MSDSAAGWQPDPTGKHDHRYWDGDGWTDHVADGGVAGTDPYEAPAAAEPTVVTPVAGVEDTTASYPTATTPPGAAPPYVPPMPAAGGDANGGGSGGASKRGLVIGGAILAAVAIAVVAFVALSGDDDDPTTPVAGETEDTTEDTTTTEDTSNDGGEGPIGNDGFAGDELEGLIADTYEETFGLSRDQAECLAGKMTEAIEDGSLTEEQAFTEVFDYLSDCDISLEEISGN